MRHSRLPLYAILGAVLIIAAWAHSFWKSTFIFCYWGVPPAQHLYLCGAETGVISIGAAPLLAGIPVSGSNTISFQQIPIRRAVSWTDFKPGTFESIPGSYHVVVINYWVILLLYTAFWLTLLTRLSRRRKSQPTPPPPH